jgi:ABC-type branched-subunit amino acid transport system ATPase component
LGPQKQLGEQLFHTIISLGAVRRQERENRERAYGILELVKLNRHMDEYAGNLSGGQKKLLALAQILMAQPKMILLDEPVAGVNPKLIGDIIDIIRHVQQEGQNFLVIEHNMRTIRDLCDRVCVLNAGKVLATGKVQETLAQEDVLRAYLGSSG